MSLYIIKEGCILECQADILDPNDVHNLTEEGGPRLALEKYLDLNKPLDNRIRIISCGGDGTAGWILSVMDNMNLPAGKKCYHNLLPNIISHLFGNIHCLRFKSGNF